MKSVISASTSAVTRILVLDCCFAGQAIPHILSDEGSLLEAAVADLKEKNTAALAAAGDYETAKRGMQMTVFTEALD